MLKKCGKFMAGWRDSNGKRHRAAFPTEAEARAHQAASNPQKQPVPSRERLRSTSKRTRRTRTPLRHSGPSSKNTAAKRRARSRRRTSKPSLRTG